MISIMFAILLALSAALGVTGQQSYDSQTGTRLNSAFSTTANGTLGYEGQPGNQGNGLGGYEGQPGNQGGH